MRVRPATFDLRVWGTDMFGGRRSPVHQRLNRLRVRVLGVSLILGLAPVYSQSLAGTVSLEWRPTQQLAGIDDFVEVALYAVSDSGSDQEIGSLQIVLTWDASRLELVGIIDPCVENPCPTDTYDWMSSGFPRDSNGPSLNADCTQSEFCPDCGDDLLCLTHSGLPFNDGNALYWALGQFAPNPSAIVTADGLWVTTFWFKAINGGIAELGMLQDFEGGTRSLVVARRSGEDILGTLGPPSQVDVVDCGPPDVVALGSRYVAITPSPGVDAVALQLSADQSDSAMHCVSYYVQPDGKLSVDAVFLSPDEWGTVFVTAAEIAPSANYSVHADCGLHFGEAYTSQAVSVDTGMWGDVNNDGTIFFDDLILVVDGSAGMFPADVDPHQLDMAPCPPDGVIDELDIAYVEAALSGESYPCLPPCWVGPGLWDLARQASCMTGPSMIYTLECMTSDYDEDLDIDLADFGVLQREFVLPPG